MGGSGFCLLRNRIARSALVGDSDGQAGQATRHRCAFALFEAIGNAGFVPGGFEQDVPLRLGMRWKSMFSTL